MTTRFFDKIKNHCLLQLQNLNPKLYYHNILHTLDVLAQAERIAQEEGRCDKHEIFLIKVAALYHDTGFLFEYNHHEERSCDLFLTDKISLEFAGEDKEIICGLIMATQIPQQPKSLLEGIICDADLDYLGRSDFFPISDNLRREFLEFGIVKTNEEWELRQYKFLKAHEYCTDSAKNFRGELKMEHFRKVESELSFYF